MNRSHSTIYRICLLAVVILTIVGGVFYYVNYVENQTRVTEGTLVKEEAFEEKILETAEIFQEEGLATEETLKEETVIEGFRPFGHFTRCA